MNKNEDAQDLAERTMKAIASMTPREKQVLLEHIRGEKILKEIGKELGVSGERIRQIESKALRKLRRTLPRKDS